MLPTPTVQELRSAAATFKVNTGTSIDGLSPKMFTWLSDCLLERIAQFTTIMEQEGKCPKQVEEALIHLIPKATGGRRPIALLSALTRLWEKTRSKYIKQWRAANARSYNWMVPGRGARRAVWAQSVLQEAARQRGLSSAAVLIDLVKAFEQVLLADLW